MAKIITSLSQSTNSNLEHNNTLNIQGGNVNERFHLLNLELQNVQKIPEIQSLVSSALQPGDITQYTNKDAQNTVGGILTDTAVIDFTYNDTINQITADVKVNSINATHLSNTINNSKFINDSNYVNQTALNLKVDKVSGKGLSTEDYSTVEKIKLAAITGINTGDQDLSSFATNSNLDLKANVASPTFTGTVSGITATMVGLSNVDNTTDLLKPISTSTQTALNGKQANLGYTPENIVNKNIANGYAGLGTDGKLLSALLPDITISDTFVTTSQAAMLALTAQTGDVSVRTDLNKSFILKINDPTVLTNWQELLTPTSAVTTVFGRNGAITAQSGDYNADQITETASRVFQTPTQRTYNDATSSIQTQLNSKEDKANKVTTITASATQYPNNDAVIAYVTANSSTTPDATTTVKGKIKLAGDLRGTADLPTIKSSVDLTGVPTAPTATAGTNTTQIANTAFVTSAISTADSGNVKLTGNQNITGQKTFNNSTASASIITNNSSIGYGVSSLNSNGGIGVFSQNTGTGQGIRSNNSSSGVGILSNQTPTGTGFNYVGQNNSTNTFTVDKLGATTATSFIKSSAPTTNILLAGGGDLAQNTAFNKNFGTAAGTVVEGNDSRLSDARTPLSHTLDSHSNVTITTNSNGEILKWNGTAWVNNTLVEAGIQPAGTYATGGGSATGTNTGDQLQVDISDIKNISFPKATFFESSAYPSNSPTGSDTYVQGMQFHVDSNLNFKQIIATNTTDLFFITQSGTWNNWRKVVTSDNGIFSSSVTATSYTATSLPVFENNAAASSLAVGQFYRTSIGVLMVKF